MSAIPERDDWLDGLVRDSIAEDARATDADEFLAHLKDARRAEKRRARIVHIARWLVPAAAAALVLIGLMLREVPPARPQEAVELALAQCARALEAQMGAALNGARSVSVAVADAAQQSAAELPAPGVTVPALEDVLPPDAANRLRDTLRQAMDRLPLTMEDA